MNEVVSHEALANEMVRLRNLQRKLKDDIQKYRQLVDIEENEEKRILSETEKDKLIENFQVRLQRNSWILKKIIFQIKQLS
jgi:hypothetical protein